MRFLLDFFHQPVPRPGAEMPGYFRRALLNCERILAVYFLLSFFLAYWQTGAWQWVTVVMFAAMVALNVMSHDQIHYLAHLSLFAVLLVFWCGWNVVNYGWGVGVQHLLLLLLAFNFFNIFEPPWMKIAFFFVLVITRMGMYAWSQNNEALQPISEEGMILFQTLNSITGYVCLAVCFILFSSSIQSTERELRLNNQELHKEAGTDALTGLMNRRAMLSLIDEYRQKYPDQPFCVAIGDIDFFKRVNDTYGHLCGDYTLQTLSKLLKERGEGLYDVCRWGGEEFCFFLPGKNLDEAGPCMWDVNSAVQRMPLHYEGIDFQITITIGVEENDFRSPMEDIFDNADKKLYMGKATGRNQVVI